MDANGPRFTPNNPAQCAGVNSYIVCFSCSQHKDRVGVSGCIVAMNDDVLKHLFVCLNVKGLQFSNEHSKLMSLLNG